MKIKALCLALVLTTPVFAEEYQSITSIDYYDHEYGNNSLEVWGVSSVYFMNKRATLGPLDEFEFINTTSYISGGIYDSDFGSGAVIGGNYFFGSFKLGANFVDEEGLNEMTFGYLFTDNFIVNIHAEKEFADETVFSISSQYKVALEGKDYMGFTFQADEEFDFPSVGMKYFSSLGEGTYLTAGLNYTDTPSDSYYAINAGYFFSEKTSLKAEYFEGGAKELTFKHFFNKNYALEIGFEESNDDLIDQESLHLSFTMQF